MCAQKLKKVKLLGDKDADQKTRRKTKILGEACRLSALGPGDEFQFIEVHYVSYRIKRIENGNVEASPLSRTNGKLYEGPREVFVDTIMVIPVEVPE